MTKFETTVYKPDKNLLKKQSFLILIFSLFIILAFFCPLGVLEIMNRVLLEEPLFSDLFWIIMTPGFLVGIILLNILLYRLLGKRINSIEYKFGLNSITVTQGVFVLSSRTIVFEKIINVIKYQGVLDRKYGIGSIVLYTASKSGTAATAVRFEGLKEFEELYEQLTNLIEK